MGIHLKTGLLLLALTLMLTACSRINLAYRNLDRLIPWSLNDYLDLDRQQRQAFKAQLSEHLDWHCRTQLPDYLEGLALVQRQVRDAQLDAAALRTHREHAARAIRAVAVEITPTAIRLLGELDDAQVAGLYRALDEKNREREEEYLDPPLPRQIRERAERMRERIEYWTGPTSAAQRQRILEWSHALGEHNRLWLDSRAHWQQALREVLAERRQASFAARLTHLLQEPRALQSAATHRAFAHAEQAGIDLAAEIFALSDRRQRNHLIERLQDLRDDLGAVRCN